MDKEIKRRNDNGERSEYRPRITRNINRTEQDGNRYGNRTEYRDRTDRTPRPERSDRTDRPERRNFRDSGNHTERRDNNQNEERRERNYNRQDHGNSYSRGREASTGRNDGNARNDFRERKDFRQEGERNYNSVNRDYNRDNRGGRDTRGSDGQRNERVFHRRSTSEGNGGYNRENRYSREDNKDNRERNFKREGTYSRERKEIGKAEKEELRQKHYSKKKILAHRLKNQNEATELRLNRYISMGGICSRRDADELIKSGRVKVNGEVMQTVGVKVHRKDRIEVDGIMIVPERKVYLVLNKPKDYVTTVEDPLERKTVMTLIEGACKERVYPIGRLDRQTTGVLLFTNDGDLAKKLTHPKFENKKIYHVFLDKAVSEQDLEAIATGIELEDGFIRADEVSFASPDRTEVGIEIHSGKNRIVRRIFEHFGYQIIKLDRVYFAGITKKNIPRGKWRFLTQDEVNVLKYY